MVHLPEILYSPTLLVLVILPERVHTACLMGMNLTLAKRKHVIKWQGVYMQVFCPATRHMPFVAEKKIKMAREL